MIHGTGFFHLNMLIFFMVKVLQVNSIYLWNNFQNQCAMIEVLYRYIIQKHTTSRCFAHFARSVVSGNLWIPLRSHMGCVTTPTDPIRFLKVKGWVWNLPAGSDFRSGLIGGGKHIFPINTERWICGFIPIVIYHPVKVGLKMEMFFWSAFGITNFSCFLYFDFCIWYHQTKTLRFKTLTSEE